MNGPLLPNPDRMQIGPSGIQSTRRFVYLDWDGHFCYTQGEILIWQG